MVCLEAGWWTIILSTGDSSPASFRRKTSMWDVLGIHPEFKNLEVFQLMATEVEFSTVAVNSDDSSGTSAHATKEQFFSHAQVQLLHIYMSVKGMYSTLSCTPK